MEVRKEEGGVNLIVIKEMAAPEKGEIMELPLPEYTKEQLEYLEKNSSRLRQILSGKTNSQNEPDADEEKTPKQE